MIDVSVTLSLRLDEGVERNPHLVAEALLELLRALPVTLKVHGADGRRDVSWYAKTGEVELVKVRAT